jgi:hypothetical protein
MQRRLKIDEMPWVSEVKKNDKKGATATFSVQDLY